MNERRLTIGLTITDHGSVGNVRNLSVELRNVEKTAEVVGRSIAKALSESIELAVARGLEAIARLELGMVKAARSVQQVAGTVGVGATGGGGAKDLTTHLRTRIDDFNRDLIRSQEAAGLQAAFRRQAHAGALPQYDSVSAQRNFESLVAMRKWANMEESVLRAAAQSRTYAPVSSAGRELTAEQVWDMYRGKQSSWYRGTGFKPVTEREIADAFTGDIARNKGWAGFAQGDVRRRLGSMGLSEAEISQRIDRVVASANDVVAKQVEQTWAKEAKRRTQLGRDEMRRDQRAMSPATTRAEIAGWEATRPTEREIRAREKSIEQSSKARKALREESQAVNEHGNAVSHLTRRITTLATAYLGYHTILSAGRKIKDIFMFQSEVEQMKLGIAEVTTTAGSFTDVLGKPLPIAEQIKLSLLDGDRAIKMMIEDAARLGLNIETLNQSYMATVGVTKAAGLNMRDSLEIVEALVVLGQRLNMQPNIIVRDIEAILSLGPRMGQTKMGVMLAPGGLTREAGKRAEREGPEALTRFFKDHLAGVTEALTQNVNTWVGLQESISTKLRALALNGGQLFQTLKDVGGEFSAFLDQVRKNPAALREMSNGVANLTKLAVGFGFAVAKIVGLVGKIKFFERWGELLNSSNGGELVTGLLSNSVVDERIAVRRKTAMLNLAESGEQARGGLEYLLKDIRKNPRLSADPDIRAEFEKQRGTKDELSALAAASEDRMAADKAYKTVWRLDIPLKEFDTIAEKNFASRPHGDEKELARQQREADREKQAKWRDLARDDRDATSMARTRREVETNSGRIHIQLLEAQLSAEGALKRPLSERIRLLEEIGRIEQEEIARQKDMAIAEKAAADRAVRTTARWYEDTLSDYFKDPSNKNRADKDEAEAEHNKALERQIRSTAALADMNDIAAAALERHRQAAIRLHDPYLHLGETIKSSMSDAITGIAMGTGKIEDFFKNTGHAVAAQWIKGFIDEKLADFDPKIKKNFLVDIGGYAREGGTNAGGNFFSSALAQLPLIGSLFSGGSGAMSTVASMGQAGRLAGIGLDASQIASIQGGGGALSTGATALSGLGTLATGAGAAAVMVGPALAKMFSGSGGSHDSLRKQWRQTFQSVPLIGGVLGALSDVGIDIARAIGLPDEVWNWGMFDAPTGEHIALDQVRDVFDFKKTGMVSASKGWKDHSIIGRSAESIFNNGRKGKGGYLFDLLYPGGTKESLTGQPGIEGMGGSARAIGFGIFGTDEKGQVTQFVNAFVNNERLLNHSVGAARKNLLELAQVAGVDLNKALHSLEQQFVDGKLSAEEYRTNAAEMIAIFEQLPGSINATRLSIAALAQDGSTDIERLKRVVDDVRSSLTGGMQSAFDALVKTGSPVAAAQAMAQQFSDTFNKRISERLLEKGSVVGDKMTDAATTYNKAAEAYAAGDFAAGDRYAAQANSQYKDAQSLYLRTTAPIARRARLVGLQMGIQQSPGIVNQTSYGMPSFATPTVATVPGPIGTPLMALVHGQESIRSPRQEDLLKDMLSQVLAHLQRDSQRPIVVQVTPELTATLMLDQEKLAQATVKSNTFQKVGTAQPQAQLGVRR